FKDGNGTIEINTTITYGTGGSSVTVNWKVNGNALTKEAIFFDDGSSAVEILIPETIQEDKEITLDLSALQTGTNVSISKNLTLTREGEGDNNYSAVIPANTIIIGDDNWNGKIILPTVEDNRNYSANNADVEVVIKIGGDSELNFSKPVKIVIGGMKGRKAGWARTTGPLTEITTVCDNISDPKNIDNVSTRECYGDSGNDLVIWTYHFTSFAAMTPIPTPTSSGGGGHSTTTNTYRIYEEDLRDGYQKALRVNNRILFTIDGESHTFKVEDITETTAKISISSETQEAILSIGEEKEFEITGDNYYDILVRLNSIDAANLKADFTIQSIHEEIIPLEEEEEITETNETEEVIEEPIEEEETIPEEIEIDLGEITETPEEEPEQPTTEEIENASKPGNRITGMFTGDGFTIKGTWWYGLAGIIVVILIIYVFRYKKRSNKKLRKR
ncbi:MAG: trimeric autotransporter adhesin, partial [Candidatus Woesearchaeota archaeon]|nr:trimeric autotransporter adhesin [Candidatus Woesearchaeota archaeon]